MTLPDPVTRRDRYLNSIAGGEAGLPEAPVSREEQFLARLAGQEAETPEPVSRTERYLAAIAWEDVPLPEEPESREEQYLSRIAGEDTALPEEPVSRTERYLAAIAEQSPDLPPGWSEYTDEYGLHHIVPIWDQLGSIIRNGTSRRFISLGDVVDINWIDAVTGTTANSLTVTCTNADTFIRAVGECEAKSYTFAFDGTDWTFGGEAVDLADFGLSVSGEPESGEIMTIVTTVSPATYTFTSLDTVDPADANVPHNWLMEQTYVPDSKAYDTYEALFCVQAGKSIPAGKYYIPMYSYRSDTTFNVCFELADAMGAATKIQAKNSGRKNATITDANGASTLDVYCPARLTPIVYGTGANAGSNISLSFLSDTDVASGNYVLLSNVNSANNTIVTIGDFDQAALGSPFWPLSNTAQWLNDDTMGDNYTPTSDFDIASDYNRGPGFLWGLDPRVRALIQTASVLWTAGYGNADYTRNATYTANQNVFLLSMKEMSFNLNIREGVITGLYGKYTNDTPTNTAVSDRIKYSVPGETDKKARVSRSAATDKAHTVRMVKSDGSMTTSMTSSQMYFAPAFIIGKALEIDE